MFVAGSPKLPIVLSWVADWLVYLNATAAPLVALQDTPNGMAKWMNEC